MGHQVAVGHQVVWRGRNDDGSQTSATWKTPGDSTPWSQPIGENFRLRFGVQEVGGSDTTWFGAGSGQDGNLQYRRRPAGGAFGAWTSVVLGGLTISDDLYVRPSLSPHVADNTATTKQLGSTSGGFAAGWFDDNDNRGTNVVVAANGHTELEFCLRLRPEEVGDGDEFEFRLRTVDDWITVASLTAVGAVPPTEGSGYITGGGSIEATGAHPQTSNSGVGLVTGGGSLEAVGEQPEIEVPEAAGTISGGGTIVATGEQPEIPITEGEGYLSGGGTVSAEGESPEVGIHEGVGQVSGTGSIEAEGNQPPLIHEAAGYISGAGAVEAVGETPVVEIHEGSGSISGGGSIEAVGERPEIAITEGEGYISGDGSITAVGESPSVGINDGEGLISGGGNLTAVGEQPDVEVNEGNGYISGVGRIEGDAEHPPLIHEGIGTISGAGTIQGVGEAPDVAIHEGAGSLSGGGNIVAVGESPEVTITEGEGYITGGGTIIGFTEVEQRFLSGLFTHFTRPPHWDPLVDPRPERWFEDQARPYRWEHTTEPRPYRWEETVRPERFHETARPQRHYETTRANRFAEEVNDGLEGLVRPRRFFEVIFFREGEEMQIKVVQFGPYTVNEVPEPLWIKCRDTLRTNPTVPVPLPIFDEEADGGDGAPLFDGKFMIALPTTEGGENGFIGPRELVIPDPRKLHEVDPRNFAENLDVEERTGWCYIPWQAGDFGVKGGKTGVPRIMLQQNDEPGDEYGVQATLEDASTLRKSQAVWVPKVFDGPASSITKSAA